MQGLKILQLGKFYPIKGGVEQVEYSHLIGLSNRGIKCDLLCAAATSKCDKRIRINNNANIYITKTWFKISSTMISPYMIIKLRQICNNYDIIHIHHPDPMACVALFFSNYKGIVVLHWHSDILKQKNMLKLYEPFQRWLIKRADIIIGTSPVYIKESPFLAKAQDKTFCIPIGVEQIEINNNKVKELRLKYYGKKIIFSLGRLVEYKGYEYLIEAANYLSDNYIILIGGSGPLKEQLQTKIDNLGLNSKVTLLGRIENDELSTYYGACDIFCLPSIYKTEAFGLVQIEAMSCGKPVIATKISGSGVSWVNKNGYSGINVEPRNASEIASAIKAITENQNIYNYFSENARNRYTKHFTCTNMIDESIKLFDFLYKKSSTELMLLN